jgi:hypothetical protein
MPNAPNVLSQTTLCVVTAEPSPALEDLLRDRGCQVIVREDLHLAMAEVCLQQRARLARAGWSGGRNEHVALVVVASPAGPSPNQQVLLASVRKYMPDVSVWTFDGTELQSHRATEANGQAGPNEDESDGHGRAPRTPGAPRGTSDDTIIADAAPGFVGPACTSDGHDSDDPDEDPARISIRELDMLFGAAGEEDLS